MKKEIGSEFHKIPFENGNGFNMPLSGYLVFSGRTAIETVLKDINEANKAILPSYCCEPFKRLGIEVSFYQVEFEDGLKIELEISEDIDILLWCNYFGFNVSMPDLTEFIKRGGVIIEDITHSLLSRISFHTQSHYLVASLRKWEPIYCGGYCAKAGGGIHNIPKKAPKLEFLECKKKAMELKNEYLAYPEPKKKKKFLQMFEESNRWIADNYSGISIDSWSKDYLDHVNIKAQRSIRYNNAMVLYKSLRGKARFLFRASDMDCPLFVPILLENREEVKQILIENHIYCPIHWPRPRGANSYLYEKELSLICDQRYDEEDMERIVSILSPLL